MKFKFHDGDLVILKKDRTSFLPAGSEGVIFCQYTTVPPAYEVNFRDINGEDFGAIVYEDEIAAVRESAAISRQVAVKSA